MCRNVVKIPPKITEWHINNVFDYELSWGCRPLIGQCGQFLAPDWVTRGDSRCRVTRAMLIISVGSLTEFVIVTLTRGRDMENEKVTVPTFLILSLTISILFSVTQCFTVISASQLIWRYIHITLRGSFYFVSHDIITLSQANNEDTLCHLSTPTLEMISGLEGGCQYQPIRVQACDSVTNERPGDDRR